MQPYQYQPLPYSTGIRILILHPAANKSSALECDIITKDRLTLLRDPDNKSFDAVSYVWGNGTHDIPLYCKHEGTYLYISAVVDEMLHNLRKTCEERRLWVDAICLNQKDNQEKSIQVQQMGQIYHMADKVHIWLGPAEATTRLSFAFLRTLVAKFEPLPGQAKDPTTEEIFQTFEETFQHRDFQSFLSLLQKSWFTRRWTLQEGFLARDAILRCGDSKVSWHWFTEGLKHIQRRSEELQGIQNDHSALYALNVLEMLRKPEDLLSLLWTLHMSQCSDHRDRIYSLLGLAQKMDPVAPAAPDVNSESEPDNSNQDLPIPDYALSTDVVFRMFASHCISTGRLLQILLHIDGFGRLSEANPKWPSWVPNWTTARDRKVHSPTAMSRNVPPFQSIDRRPLLAFLGDHYLCPQTIYYSNGNHHGLLIYGSSFLETVKICEEWPRSRDSDHLVKYLTDWIHQETILHLSDVGDLDSLSMERKVNERLCFLIAGTEFFGYAKHVFFSDSVDTKPRDWWSRKSFIEMLEGLYWPWASRVANILYPIDGKGFPFNHYTREEIRRKEHLDKDYQHNPPPTAECRQALSYLLDDVSRMMQEGRKRLIVAYCDEASGRFKRQHWIAPEDVRMGDVITGVSICGRIGALLRPVNTPSELDGRPTFQLIGIVWSLENYYEETDPSGEGGTFLIL